MTLTCCACHKQAKVFYCGHCLNTSPQLLLKLKLELYHIRAANEQLRSQVDSILEKAMDEDSRSQDVLARNLSALKTAHLKRRTNKFRHKTEQARIRVKEKAKQAQELREVVEETDFQLETRPEVRELSLKNRKDRFQTYQFKLDQLQKVLANAKAMKFQTLVHLFLIREREHPEFSYTISFQPIINIQNLHRLPTNVVECSLRSMWEFLRLAAKVLLVELPSTTPANEVLHSLTGIVLNMLVFLRTLGLIPQNCADKRAHLRALLRDYDVDKLFYYMVMNRKIPQECQSKNETFVNYEVCHHELQNLLQGSKNLGGVNNTMDDKWFLVE
ncbi:LADA_0C03730g1_1 [Lachancea dasiensis]|uniref:Autophagy-related protein 14 n=1 Tax=Lachancea dasiensis TaxID=1072105 RepID=A0A1G4IYT1_9SACH|nr:LADA_0C03730g1_1 [Lachancea dasiensis]